MKDSLHHRKPVFVISDSIVSALGFDTAGNISRMFDEESGIGQVDPDRFSSRMLPFALVNDAALDKKTGSAGIPGHFTRLERMMLLSASDALHHSGIDASDHRVLFLISSTKGNIDGLSADQQANLRPSLWALGERVRNWFGNPNRAVMVSNACVSGVLAVEIAARMLRSGTYDHAVVTGGDLVTRFVVSGFESFLALSERPCRPYDAHRNGLTLGEGCAALVLSIRPPLGEYRELITISGGASSSDAVHISAPDRTGAGLSLAIKRALNHSGVQAAEIDAVCAHGTATVYNDDMESQAMHAAHLSKAPVYSLKGYWGHTLGAAGLMETVATVHSLRQQRLFRTLGFESPGTTAPLNVVDKTGKACLKHILKTASGFGGCNAALVVSRL
ncbi:MAG: hypothetical protein LBL04_07175 [Bacteroidales bacterium]|jgi:3-oxoacyl-[acyl-carrier-protein] synthase-1|nr:hypothetical protein [Bacteroidales bacterium]